MDESPTIIKFFPLCSEFIEHCFEDELEDGRADASFICVSCKRRYDNAYAHAAFAMSIKGGKGGWICSVCVETFRDPSSFGARLFR